MLSGQQNKNYKNTGGGGNCRRYLYTQKQNAMRIEWKEGKS